MRTPNYVGYTPNSVIVYSMFTIPSMRSTDLVSERLCENPK